MHRAPSRRSLRRALSWFTTTRGLTTLFAIGFVLRLVLALFGAFQGDLDIFRAWSDRLVDVGPGEFYAEGFFADYPPGYLYVLWLLGRVARLLGDDTASNYLLKLPGVLADMGIAWMAVRIADRASPRSWGDRGSLRALVAAAVLFNPAFLFVSAIWGQVDSLTAFFVLAAFLLITTGRTSLVREAGGVAILALAFGSKPQAVFLLPVVGLYLVWRHLGGARSMRDALKGVGHLAGLAVVGAVVMILLGLPFRLDPIGLFNFYRTASQTYPYTSVWAFNLWGLAGFWNPDVGADAIRVFGVPAFYLGLALVAVGTCIVLFRLWRALGRGEHETRAVLLAGAAISLLVFAVSTRMHERYLFLGVACLAPFVGSKVVRRGYIAMSALYLVNLYFPYVYYAGYYDEVTSFSIKPVFNLMFGTEFDSIQKKAWSLVTGLVCLYVVWAIARWLADRPFALLRSRAEAARMRARTPRTIGLHPIGRRGALIALAVFAVALATRLIGLSSPPGMQFDEVYHARAAGEYIAGKEVFEFTHPPLAKELMAVSVAALVNPRQFTGGPSPPGIEQGIVATEARRVAWAASDGPGGGDVYTGAFSGECDLAVTERMRLAQEPSAVALTSSGVLVATTTARAGVVSSFSRGEELWRTRIPAPARDLVALGSVAFAVTEDDELLLVEDDGDVDVVRKGVVDVAGDLNADRVWASVPDDKLVAAYDATGAEKASITTFGRPGPIVLANELPRVIVSDTAAPRLEGINPDDDAWSGQLEGVPADGFAHVPEADALWSVEGRHLRLLEGLGLSVIGETELPFDPVAFAGDLDRNLLVALGDDRLHCVSADNAFAWRFPSALLGSALIAVVFLLALRCFGSVVTGLIAAALASLDGLLFVTSRVAMIEAHLGAFIVAAWLCAISAMYHFRGRDGTARRAGTLWLLGCGLFSGAAMAAKWTGVYSLAGIIALLAWDAFRNRDEGIFGWLGSRRRALAVLGIFVVALPVVVYVVSYAPYFSLGHSFGEWLSLQKSMYEYHANLKAGHQYASSWYEWPFGRRAVFFYVLSREAQRMEIWTIGNPVVFLGGVVSLLVLAVRARRDRLVAWGVVPWAVLALFIPWVLVPRELFLYHYVPVVPFLALALAWWLTKRDAAGESSWVEVATVVGAALFAFVATFPMLDGWYVPQAYLDQVRAWLPWVF